MEIKYYPLLGGILVLVVVGFLFWQKNITETKNLTSNTLAPTTSNDIKINLNNNMATTSNGLEVEVLKQGAGQEAKNGDNVSVHYTGYLTNGQVFDSNIASADPFVFTLGTGDVIKGWDQGVLGMKVGERRKLTIPADLAYGVQGAKNLATGEYVISPNTPLVFDVEMIKIEQ